MGIGIALPSKVREMGREPTAPESWLGLTRDILRDARGRELENQSRAIEERLRYGKTASREPGIPLLRGVASSRLPGRGDASDGVTASEQSLRGFLRLMKADRFPEALRYARNAGYDRALLNVSADPAELDLRAEAAVYYGQNLVYTGELEEARAVLQNAIETLTRLNLRDGLSLERGLDPGNWRRNLSLGRAYNVLGYLCYLELGQYRRALRLFEAALPYFEASDHVEELANTGQNMGIAYSLLGEGNKATAYLAEALEIRQRLRLPYRLALSREAYARAYIEAGQPHRARNVGEQAYDTCKELNARRGIGLTAVTVGRAYHGLARLTTVYDDRKRLEHECRAVKLLEEARDIFANQVFEPVRSIEALLALGQCYSNLALFPGSGEGIARERQRRALACLGEAVDLAGDRHPVHYVSACIEMARHHLQTRGFDQVPAWLQRAEDAIPQTYRLRAGGTADDDPGGEPVDEYWRQAGEIEMIRGHLAFDRATRDGACDSFREAASQAILCYAWAFDQWHQFQGSTPEHRGLGGEIVTRLRLGSTDDFGYVRETIFPQVELRVGRLYDLPELLEHTPLLARK